MADPEPPAQPVSPAPGELPVGRDSLAQGHEIRDVNVRGVLFFAGALLVAAVIIHIGLWRLLESWSGSSLIPRPQVPPAVVTPPAAAGPGLQAEPPIDLERLRAEEMKTLTTYGWVDQKAGTVHIPIDQAMQLLVKQGLPARAGQPITTTLEPGYRLDSSGGTRPAGQ